MLSASEASRPYVMLNRVKHLILLSCWAPAKHLGDSSMRSEWQAMRKRSGSKNHTWRTTIRPACSADVSCGRYAALMENHTKSIEC